MRPVISDAGITDPVVLAKLHDAMYAYDKMKDIQRRADEEAKAAREAERAHALEEPSS